MADLIAFATLAARPGFEGVIEDEVLGLIADASALARLEVSPDLDDVDDTDCPAAVTAILATVIRRAFRNPLSATQEALGDYSYSIGSSGLGGIYLTARERRLLRRAVGRSAVTAISTEVTTVPTGTGTGILEREGGTAL